LSDLQQGKAEPVLISPELVALGRQCGELFGLELYGVDCILTPDGPTVIEVNEFPNYTAVPNAKERLAHYVIQQTREG
jgi:ribosomal protein S6--L-glutamate ligase